MTADATPIMAERAPNRVAGDLWVVFNLGDANARYQRFLARGRPPLKNLIESVVLHPQVVVPTEDFLSLTVLVGTLGESAVIRLLESGRLRFARLRGSICYGGGGAGLAYYEIGDPNSPFPHAAPIDAAIDWALSGLNLQSRDPLLPKLAIAATSEIVAKEISDSLRDETYRDVISDPVRHQYFWEHNRDMQRLQGIGPKEVRIYGGPDEPATGDEIDIVLAVAAANVELRLGQLVGDADLSTSAPIGHLLKTKGKRAFGAEAGESFAQLREIAGIPDVGELVLSNDVEIQKLIKLAESRDGQQFQGWFHQNCRTDAIGAAREYVKLLNEIPHIQRAPAKVLRFLITSVLGKIPILGEVASLADSFVVERLLRGPSPKYFIENLVGLSPPKKAG